LRKNRLTGTVKNFQNALNDKIDVMLEGIRISFQKALALHRDGRVDLERSAGDLSRKLSSISDINSRLLRYKAELNHS